MTAPAFEPTPSAAATTPTYHLVEWLFLRALGLIYLSAFVSLAVQVQGLIGSDGILPAAEFFKDTRATLGNAGYWQVPSLFWLNASDGVLLGGCLAGILLSLLVVAGWWQRAALIGLFGLYLSYVTAGQIFMAYQWDGLLLEAGFLAIFIELSPLVIYLFRWLLFRLNFMSGLVKLTSGDPTWRNLTALDYHYLTQPLPTVFGWFAYQQPEILHRISTGGVFVVELGLPFLIFGPRRWRFVAAAGILSLQSLIFLTGNYTFFNLLTGALCLFLFDDAALRRVVPARFWNWFSNRQGRRPPRSPRRVQIGQVVTVVAAVPVVSLSLAYLLADLAISTPAPIVDVLQYVAPFQVTNSYGLFAEMTTSRQEIIIEGSNDGVIWQDYQFPFKPGDERLAPRWAAPYQPRLDWQMWFAALGSQENSPWMQNLMVRLLQGSPSVLRLLAVNPFPTVPPRYVRAELYEYSFTDWDTLRAYGRWWQRTPLGDFIEPESLP